MYFARVNFVLTLLRHSPFFTPMKKFFFALLLFAAVFSQAQTSLNGFGAPLIQAAPLDGDWRANLGAGGALLINRHFYVGAYGMSMLGNVERKLFNPEIQDSVIFPLRFAQAGLWLGYFVNPDNKLQVTVNSFAGVGSISTSLDCNCGPDRIFLVSPYLGLQYAAADFMRIELAAGYRVVGSDNDLDLFGGTNLSAPFAGLHLKFGGFE